MLRSGTSMNIIRKSFMILVSRANLTILSQGSYVKVKTRLFLMNSSHFCFLYKSMERDGKENKVSLRCFDLMKNSLVFSNDYSNVLNQICSIENVDVVAELPVSKQLEYKENQEGRNY